MSSRLIPNTIDAAVLADELARFRVVDSAVLADLLAEFSGSGPAALVEFLVNRDVLTPFQADRVLAGEIGMLALGPFRLTSPAGPGTFGPVFSATHKDKPGELFRVRVFPLRSLWRARQAKQLARALAKCPHPAIVPPTDADSANGYHYFVWPHAEGQSLPDRVAARPLSAGETVGMLAHLADALHACHVRKVTHGALTPRAVLLAPDGLPRLLDLGAGAVLAANLAEDESLLDTMSAAVAVGEVMEYAAPEYATDPTPTPANDQYALGAIGYFALCGLPPFPELSATEQLAAKQTTAPTPLNLVNPAIPVELAAIIGRMLSPSPADRFPSLDAVHDHLAALAMPLDVPRSRMSEHTPKLKPEYLPLSQLRERREPHEPGRSSGSVQWPTPGSGIALLPSRDDSDASVTFELPDLVPEEVAPSPTIEPMGTPSLNVPETQSPQSSGSQVTPGLAPSPVPLLTPGSPTSSPVAPAPHTASTDGQQMAKFPKQDAPDPRKGVEPPVHYHTETCGTDDTTAREGDDRPLTDSVRWKKLKRSLLFWKAATDVIQVSVYGPAAIVPGLQAKVSVYLHTPDSAESVRTLSRAFHHDSELIGTGYVAKEVAREAKLEVHLSVVNAGVTKSLFTLVWRGQPYRVVFDLHVPWEAPSGAAPGLVSIGLDNIRIGKTEFRLNMLPRKA